MTFSIEDTKKQCVLFTSNTPCGLIILNASVNGAFNPPQYQKTKYSTKIVKYN